MTRNGKPKSPLKQWLDGLPEDSRPTWPKLAERLDCSVSTLAGWLAMTRRPSPEKMVKIEDETGIPVRAWVGMPPTRDPRWKKRRAA